MDEIPEMRVCSTCKVEKPLTGFYKYKYKGNIKHKAQCKCYVDEKKREYNKTYYSKSEKRRKYIKEHNARYYEKIKQWRDFAKQHMVVVN